MTTTYLSDGGYVVVSVVSGNFSSVVVHAQKYSAEGAAVGPEFTYSEFARAADPIVVALSTGGYALETSEYTGAHFGDPVENLFVFDAAGQQVGTPATQSFTGATTLTASPSGGFIYALGGGTNPFDPGSYGARFFLYDNSGNLLGGGPIAANTAPSVSVLANGSFELSWQDSAEGNAIRTLTIDPLSPPDLSQPKKPVLTAFDDVSLYTGAIGNLSNDPTPTIRVAVQQSGAIEISNGVGSAWYAVTDQDIAQGYKDITVTLSDGSQDEFVRVEGANGVVGPSATLSWTIDTVAPTQVGAIVNVIDDVGPSTGTVPSGGTTDDTTPTVQVAVGSWIANGDAVQLIINGTPTGNPVPVTSTDLSNGTISITPSALADGTYAFSDRTVDAAGNAGPASATWTITVQTAGGGSNQASAEILWQSDNGQPAVWLMNGITVVSGGTVDGNPGSSWHLKASSDFDGDGHPDILWQSDNGTAAIWYTNGTSVLGSGIAGFNPGSAWHVIGAGDFNADGHADIVWQNSDGTPAIWLMNGTGIVSGASLNNPGSTWHIIATGDFNADGKSDILWQSDSGQAAIWLMDGTSPIGGGLIGGNPGSTWHVKAAADFNGDGMADILWQNSDGTPAIWLMNGNTVIGSSTLGANPGTSWQVIGAADLNGDGKADVLWQNSDGTPAIWLMNGLSIAGSGIPNFNPGSAWHALAMSA